MVIPFSTEQFLSIFYQYNLSVFPMQIFLYLLAILAIIFIAKELKNKNKFILGILAFLWIWAGVTYHLIFFTSINNLAYIFGGLFIAQGIILITLIPKEKLSFKFKYDNFGITGLFFIIYSLILYPILNYAFNHTWPFNPTFGLPCPLTIFTFGILLWTNKKFSKYILIIPLLWSLIGISAAINLGITEDIMLPIAGITTTIMLYKKYKKKSKS